MLCKFYERVRVIEVIAVNGRGERGILSLSRYYLSKPCGSDGDGVQFVLYLLYNYIFFTSNVYCYSDFVYLRNSFSKTPY